MYLAGVFSSMVMFLVFSNAIGQRITTIQLDGVQYFISRMNPYSPELNFFLSYQYCRSLGLQLASFESKEKADSIAQYLKNTGYGKYDFWISGNVLGTGMPLWMSTGLPFNATFSYMRKHTNEVAASNTGTFEVPSGSTSPQRTARESGNNNLINSCVAMKAPTFEWDTDDCTLFKDFICEQTRCYYYNYGPIPVSSAQGKQTTTTTTTTVQPYTSSPATQETPKYLPMTINKLLNKLRASTYSTSVIHESNTPSPTRNEDAEIEFATNGPYDNIHVNSELQDDPAAIADHAEDYVSTVEPDTVTTFSHS